ncbi:MAG TPA: YraN family protein [Pseudonocardiaceae bacterium]|jgi:putative endonuclease|nr:YraN family protein [Pseudonocardiaceae bacterium]
MTATMPVPTFAVPTPTSTVSAGSVGPISGMSKRSGAPPAPAKPRRANPRARDADGQGSPEPASQGPISPERNSRGPNSHGPDSRQHGSSPPGHVLGRLGEELAAQYLEILGFVLLARNWRCRDGELDIVATDGHSLVVVEVKTRTNDDFGTPADAMTPVKIRRIKAATRAWLRSVRAPWCEISYDLIAIWWPPTGKPRMQHLRGAF